MAGLSMTQPDPTLIADLLRRALAQGQRPWLTVSSNSMLPLLAKGDAIQMAPCSAETLPPGEIVVVESEGALLAHRYQGLIWRQGQAYVLTRGDRPLATDPLQPDTALLGWVVARRRGQRILAFDQGGGRRLNAHLAALANWEATVLAPVQRRRGWYWPVRLCRALILRWGYGVVALFTFSSGRLKDSHVDK